MRRQQHLLTAEQAVMAEDPDVRGLRKLAGTTVAHPQG